MKLFKSVDDKLLELGFIKIRESKLHVSYERENELYGYTQVLDICHKESGLHIIQSYQKKINQDGHNNMVGLSYIEALLAAKKMKTLGWVSKINNK